MRKLFVFLVFFVFFVFTMSALSSVDNQSSDLEPISILGTSTPVWQILEDLDAGERGNAIIEIECDAEAEAQANLIEDKWNSGNYDEAIELLKNSSGLENAAIGIQWKEPIKTSSLRWGDDVRIGNRDSIQIVSLDVDNSTGNLFAALKYISGSQNYWSVNISTDTGSTWVETYTWGSVTSDIYGVVCENYFYVGYSVTSGTGRIRRFSLSDGTVDAGYGFLTVIDEGVNLRDIALASTTDNPGGGDYHYLLYFAIMDNDSLRLYWSDTAATAWDGTFDPNVGIADRGLDASSQAATTTGNNMWASFIGTDDSLYAVEGWSGWTHHGPLDYVGTEAIATTSIAAYEDTIMITFPHYDGSSNYDARYRVSYDEGDNWGYGTLADTTDDIGFMNDITGRNGDGFGVVYQTEGSAAAGFYRHRGYPVAPGWSTQEIFSDSVTRYYVKPSIERIADNVYGIIYSTYPEEIALFDRSDWIPGGIPENNATSDGKIECSLDCGIITGTATLKYALPTESNVNVSVVNLLGQTVATLDKGLKGAGEHTVNISAENLSQGIYFIVVKTGNGQKGIVKAAVLK